MTLRCAAVACGSEESPRVRVVRAASVLVRRGVDAEEVEEVEEVGVWSRLPPSPRSAHAVPVPVAIAAPMPSATAKAPTRPI